MAVKDCKETDDHRCNSERWPILGHYRGPEQNCGSSDANFGPRQRDAQQAKHPAHRHNNWESNWQKPNSRCAKLRSPQPYRNHRYNMIETRDRVMKTCEKANRFALHAVRK
jgi:hypothetical protein